MHKRKASAPILGDWPSDSKRRCERGAQENVSSWRKAKSEERQILDHALLKYTSETTEPLGGLRFTPIKELTTRLEIPPFEDNHVQGGNLYGGSPKEHPQSSTNSFSPPKDRFTTAQLSILEKAKNDPSNSIYEKVKTGEESKEEMLQREDNCEQMKNDASDPLCGGMSDERPEQDDVKHVGTEHFKITNGSITRENEDQTQSSFNTESVSKEDNNGADLSLRGDKWALTKPRVRSDPPLLSTLSDELLCCTSNGSDETNKRSGTHECITLPKGKEGGSSPCRRTSHVYMNHHGDAPSDEEKTFCETLISEGTSSKRIYHFRRSKNNIHIYTPGGGTYLTIKDNGEETPESMTSEQSNETLHCGSGQMKVKEEVNPGEEQKDTHFVNTQSASFLRSNGESNHTYNKTDVRKRQVTYELEYAQMNSKSCFADGQTETTPHEMQTYACKESLHPRRQSEPGRTRKRKLTSMLKKKVKVEKKKKKKKKIPGQNLQKVIVRGKECWRAEWFAQKSLQGINCHDGDVHVAMANAEMSTETNMKMKTEKGSGSFQMNYPHDGVERRHNRGNENSLVKKSRQFSVSVYGPENARLFALFELIKYNSVPDSLRDEANVCICTIKKNLMGHGGSSNKSRSAHFLPLMFADWDDAYSPALVRKIQGDMVRNWGQFPDGGSSDVHGCSGNKEEEPPRASPYLDGYNFPLKGNHAGGFDHMVRCGGDFTNVGENPPNRVTNGVHADNASSHNQNNLVHSINAYNLHSRHMAHTFAANANLALQMDKQKQLPMRCKHMHAKRVSIHEDKVNREGHGRENLRQC
ncbi:hypothetical protein AK88_03319 [Plasmodium fragile]|uniref:Uncharacterized protein n=1 Tax=Plasmodium fragile TaxID=5857 RepID=A0A0D9QIZ3_PLAFR|nr:uncharacterized protein AK88_03319 [Plasmodium fragile]KJP87035.1 hypothetical protein AK88_03319 [Plasmodium fragile]